jgi:DNA-binding transcriptional LysR family regulator
MDWRSIQFDWNRARAFYVTAKEGSFSAAARALNMTQPTLGRQVTALEEEIGVLLFDRNARGLILTSSGSELLEYVEAMANAANGLSIRASSRIESIEGNVSITVSEVVAAFILPPIIKKIRQKAPLIRIEVIATNDSSDLLKREADIAIRAYRPKELDLVAKKVSSINGHLYASHDYIETLPTNRTIADINQADFLTFDTSERLANELNQVGFNVGPTNFPIACKSHLVHWEFVKNGLGIGFMIDTVGEKEKKVARVLPNQAPFEVEMWLVVHKELYSSKKLRLVFDLLAHELSSYKAPL